MKILIGAAFLALLSATASAQDDERVKRIVERIEREIRDSHERTRDEIRAIIRAELQKGGKPATPAAPGRKVYLGITAGDMTDDERKAHAGGIKVAEVRGPAKEAGVVPGDFLTEIDQREVSEENIGELLSKHQPGDAVEVTIVRGKKSRHLKVVLGERKE
jgi:S1-C subfamily serine protease